MRANPRSEDGFLTIELTVAIVLITIALLALMAAYDQAFFSLHSSAKTSSAGLVAETQLELYASLPYSSIGLDSATRTTTKSSDANYSTDEAALPGSGTDVTISSCGSSARCAPVQTLTGSDGRSYKLETFIRAIAPAGSTWTEKVITVIVRDMSKSGSPQVFEEQTAFDHGPG
ncbi:MAG: type IV pilus modification PilV family protein [Gaiellaceae bacterium]